jgi:cleavage and polyadenylation specificity factor subunit 1
MELEEWEHVTCLKNVSLAYEGTRSGLKGYIAVGTNYNYGEDITSRGRVRTSEILTQDLKFLYIVIESIVSSCKL